MSTAASPLPARPSSLPLRQRPPHLQLGQTGRRIPILGRRPVRHQPIHRLPHHPARTSAGRPTPRSAMAAASTTPSASAISAGSPWSATTRSSPVASASPRSWKASSIPPGARPSTPSVIPQTKPRSAPSILRSTAPPASAASSAWPTVSAWTSSSSPSSLPRLLPIPSPRSSSPTKQREIAAIQDDFAAAQRRSAEQRAEEEAERAQQRAEMKRLQELELAERRQLSRAILPSTEAFSRSRPRDQGPPWSRTTPRVLPR